jgi:hypothetical protein
MVLVVGGDRGRGRVTVLAVVGTVAGGKDTIESAFLVILHLFHSITMRSG